ncbi:TPA: type II glyceraldehyde-3-phosphate dehydrogenase, partial [Candidatus Woesearchaeota archaeon]|nr:type II glyceraldehyde-3-phosphate dehydrogenase [Candidatus Woesearchaeota archaeon]HIJ18607.1 type II glyceraldehyde-3-phosphate dehydrogenase [Candidatus Woesearchaeota archaeon]
NSYSWLTEVAQKKGYDIYSIGDQEAFKQNGIKIAGTIQDLMGKVDVIVDGAPKKIGKENLEKFYKPNRIKATFQGGEKHATAGTSFVAQCNYNEAVGKDYVRVVSCNTTGLVRTLNEINRLYGIDSVHATMIRRGADPADIYHGPINGIVPVLEMPSHHGPDVQTVLKGVEIFTTALSVSTTLMHVHSIIADLKRKPDIQEVIQRFKDAARIRVVRNAEVIRSTAQIMELAKDLGFARGDMPEICVWEEAIGIDPNGHNKLFYMQAVHQESDVVPENVDAIRAMMGEKDAQKSIRMTNEAMGIK